MPKPIHVNAYIPHNVMDVWEVHRKNAGYKTRSHAMRDAIELHKEYLLSGRSPFFIIDEILADRSEELCREVEEKMLQRISRVPTRNMSAKQFGFVVGMNLALFALAACVVGFIL